MKTLPDHIQAPCMHAGFWMRVGAWFIDLLILLLPLLVLELVRTAAANGGEAGSAALLSLCRILALWLYYALFESSALQATPGKLAMGLRVTDQCGNRIGFGCATGRYFGKILSGLTLGVGFMMAGWTRRKQCLHDLLAGTCVVRKESLNAFAPEMRTVTHFSLLAFVLLVSIVLSFAAAPALAAGDPLAPMGTGSPPPTAPIKPVTEKLWGVKVTDNYRYMEKLQPSTIAWMKAQGAYARKVMDAITPLAALQKRVSAFTGSFGVVQDFVSYGGRDFYEERAPGAEDFDLMLRDSAGTRKLLDVTALRKQHSGEPYAINWFSVSPDGSKVAVGVSEGGSENAEMTVYDVATGEPIAGPIPRVQFGMATTWSGDSGTVFYNQFQAVKPGQPESDKYLDSTVYAWNLKSAPVAVLGAKVGHGPTFGASEFPVLIIVPGAPLAAAISVNGEQQEIKVWLAPAERVADTKTTWKPFIVRSDDVTWLAMRGEDIFLRSHKNAPTFKVLDVKAGQPLSSAKTLVQAQSDRVVEKLLFAASDGLYVLTRKGAYSQLLRIPAGGDKAEEIALPFESHITEAFAAPQQPGITLELSSWVVQPTYLRYDPSSSRFADLKIGHRGEMDAAAFEVRDLEAKARDGVEVPLTLIQPKDAHGPQATIVEGYGAYGISELADFSTRRAAAMREGISYAICHVRGGGEKGETWRLGGKDASKHNTWQDLIACGEDLLARGVTTKDKLFILGGSAGGITVGRAMTERPDLFAGVLDIVPDTNTLRMEFSASGPGNIPEFGTIKTERGFKNLYAMDSIQHVEKGITYPAVMITTGLNDPRVEPWQPAKFAAALQASGTPNPVLLRVDSNAGHGLGSNRSQTDRLSADTIAFVFWRAGRKGWRPDARH